MVIRKDGQEMKKVLKVIAIIAGIAGAAFTVYVAVTKYLNKKQTIGNPEENYVSCSCFDDDFVTEAVV